jgi:hypothetical protein
MLKFFFFSALVMSALTVGGILFVPLLILGAMIWLVTLPFRLAFALVGGLIHAVFAIIGAVLFAPVRLLRRAV